MGSSSKSDAPAATASAKSPPVKGRRALKLAAMTMSVAGQYARGKLAGALLSRDAAERTKRRAASDAGARIVQTLGELRGAAMKVGQMASMATDLLPKELSEALTGLQREAPPMPYPVIEQQIRAEFDQPVEQLFGHFEREPFAAASIGQVHRARTDDGRDVVVKVQYPGVDRAVGSDLQQLKLALRASGLLQVNRSALDAVFAEVQTRLQEELDYCNEADSLRAFGRFHARHPFVVVPKVVGERSAQRVLTLTHEPGDAASTLIEHGYARDEIDHCARNLWAVLDSQAFDFGWIHADPNPANFAFRRDGTVVLYDFGCTKRLGPDVMEAYVELLCRGLEGDLDGVDAQLLSMGMREPGSPPPRDTYERLRAWFLPKVQGREDLDFSDLGLHDPELVAALPALWKERTCFQPAADLVFFERAVGGHCATLRKLGARVPVQRMIAARAGRAAELLGIEAPTGAPYASRSA